MQLNIRKAALISTTLLAHLGISHAANAQSAGSREPQNATYRNIVALEWAYCAAPNAGARNCLTGAPPASPGYANTGYKFWIAGEVAARQGELSIIDPTIGHQPIAREAERPRIAAKGRFRNLLLTYKRGDEPNCRARFARR